jgi:hypothetical protein
MVLYFVIFGNLIGRQIGDMGGFTYMEYIVPGLIMMSVITNSYGNVVSSFFGSKFQRSIEELMVSPVSPHTILIGYPGRCAARADGGRDRDAAVAVLHPFAGASPGRDRSGGGADGDDLLAAGLHQRGVCAQLR